MLLQRILIAGIVCCAPLLVYFLVLIGLNSRYRATLVPGTWDFAGVLLGCSGFILGGGPLVLAGLNAVLRSLIVRGRPSDWFQLSGPADVRALLMWALFFLMVTFGSTLLIWRRRSFSVIYNADTEHIWSALEWVFGRLAIVSKRIDNRYELQKPIRPAASWRPGFPESPAKEQIATNASEPTKLIVHVLPSNRNVTLHWRNTDPDIRGQVEAELGRLLPNIRAAENPALTWFVSAATTLFGLIVIALIFLLVAAVRSRQMLGV